MKIEVDNKEYTLRYRFDKDLYNTLLFQEEKQVIKEKIYEYVFKHLEQDPNLEREQMGICWYVDYNYSILFSLQKKNKYIEILVGDMWRVSEDDLRIEFYDNEEED